MNNMTIKSPITTIPINISPPSSTTLLLPPIPPTSTSISSSTSSSSSLQLLGGSCGSGGENLFMKCRICVTDITDNSITIFNKDFLDEKIKKYLYVNIDFTDKYPKRLCKTCLVKLEEIHQFACFAQKNQQIFIRYVEYLKLQDKIGNILPHQQQQLHLPPHQLSTNQPAPTITSENNRINTTPNYLNTNTLFSNRDITIFSYDNLKLGHFIKDIDLLKLILKALKWETNPKTLSEQLDKLRNANFRDILSNPDLLQDEDLTQLLGPYTNRGELNLMITRHNPSSASTASSAAALNNFNNEVVCLIGDDDDDDNDDNKITEMEVGVDPDLFFPYDDDETRSAEEILQANNKLNELKPILCYECPQIFYSEAEIMEHNKLKHDTSVRLVPKKRKITKPIISAVATTTTTTTIAAAATVATISPMTVTTTTTRTTLKPISVVEINKNPSLFKQNNSKLLVPSSSSSLTSTTKSTTAAKISSTLATTVPNTVTSTTITNPTTKITPKITTITPIKSPQIENITVPIVSSTVLQSKTISPLKTPIKNLNIASTLVAASQNVTNIPTETVITKVTSPSIEILSPPVKKSPIIKTPTPVVTPPPAKKQKTLPPPTPPPILKIPTPQILHARRKRKVDKTSPTNTKTTTPLTNTTSIVTSTPTYASTRQANVSTLSIPSPPPPPLQSPQTPPPQFQPSTPTPSPPPKTPTPTPPPKTPTPTPQATPQPTTATTTPKSTNKKENTKTLQRTRTPSKRLQSREKNHTPFLCTQCPKKLSTKGNLKVHIESHKVKGKFYCEKCDRVFKSNNNLIQHKKYHLDEKFICPTCDRVYPLYSALRAHIVSHSNERPHTCTVCNKQFKRNQDLKFHMNQHTGDKPYKCPHCTKTFASSGNCFSHRKRMHSNKV